MSILKTSVPDGVRDFPPDACYSKRVLQTALLNEFALWGYDEVETPCIEFYDVFSSEAYAVHQERMLKFFDEEGRIVVLRPDLTVPIARMCAAHYGAQRLPLRFCYAGKAFGRYHSVMGEQKEFTQAGVELLGLSGADADAEILSLAAEALSLCSLEHFVIDIGQVEFFKGLAEQMGLNAEQSEAVRGIVNEKNTLALEIYLKQLGVPNEMKHKLLQMPLLYGGAEVFDKALALSSHPRCKAAVDNLKGVYERLQSMGLEAVISIDLGMLHSIDYYSGIIFRGMTGNLGHPILSGGRYDGLYGEFHADMPATGFALNINRLMDSLQKQDALSHKPNIDAVVASDAPYEYRIYEAAASLREQGLRTILAGVMSEREARDFALDMGASCAYHIGADGSRRLEVRNHA